MIKRPLEENLKSLYGTTKTTNFVSIEKAEQNYFEKGGKRAQIGEVRMYGGEPWVKHADGWVHVNKNTGKATFEGKDGKRRPAEQHHIDHHSSSMKNHSSKEESTTNQDTKPKLIGYTSSGKPIYKDIPLTDSIYDNFSKEDRSDWSKKMTQLQHQEALDKKIESQNKLLQNLSEKKSLKNEINDSNFKELSDAIKLSDNKYSVEDITSIDTTPKGNFRISIKGRDIGVNINKDSAPGREAKKIQSLLQKQSENKLPQNSPEIGKTKSGKTIYQDGSELEGDDDWTSEDHKEAASKHKEGKYYDKHNQKSEEKKDTLKDSKKFKIVLNDE